MFTLLYPSEKFKLAMALTTVHYKAGDVIMKEGEEGSDMFICEEGEVEVRIRKIADPDGHPLGRCAFTQCFNSL